ncbi:type IX secretion system membrane protein PorP/SprF [Flammeovirga pectinis]|uniref:Type IX secretion system membrane protein PorP/SprF n=1 Tax=Flammeovirga pectinis TaxID=2494373 RepID=A0A3S9PAT5_9BACT|nr:type IX secretion system membrane protein PorP/SprF [Flammeovirga pectinis]AZQ65298.1 type IX secretion system membrane protein PorP/SprF [Flammeovirga pectinis]
MKVISIYIALLFFTSIACMGQQMPMFSQYAYNTLAINPAIAGTKDGVNALMLYRKQWSDYEGAPSTINFSASSNVSKGKFGVGVNFVNDKIGISNNNTVQGAFSYILDLNNNLRLSLGMYLSLLNFQHDWGALRVQQTSDPLFANGKESLFNFNTGFGAYLYNKRFYVSFSIPNILETKMSNTSESYYLRHYFLKGGVHFDLSRSVEFVPSVLFKYVKNNNIQGDITATFIFQKMLWLGVSYRSEDGIALLSQVVLKERFRIGYAYDYPHTEIQKATSGTHEILLGIRINKKSPPSNIITSPRYF